MRDNFKQCAITGSASYPGSTTFTKCGLTVTVPAKSSLTADQQTVVQGLYSWWIEEALKLIEDSYGYSFTDSDATVKTINLEFENKPNSTTLAYVSFNSNAKGNSGYKANKLTLVVNMGRFNNLSASDKNGSGGNSSFYLDRTLAHELTHAIMAAKITNFAYLHDFLTEGMAELTHGIDDERQDLIECFAENPSKLQSFLHLDANVTGDMGEYAAGYMLLRYLAKQSEGLEPPADTTSGGGTDTGSGDGTETLSGGSSSITNWSTNNTVLTGTSGNDTISNYGSYVTINTGAGNDSISNANYRGGGSNVMVNAGAGDDSISNWGGTYLTINAGDGNNYIYSSTSSSVNNHIKIDAGAGNDTITNYGGSYVTINAGEGNDTVYNYGGNNVQIYAGAGNDTVYIANYSDQGKNILYKYSAGDGNDTITGLDENDTLQISGSSYTTATSGYDLVFSVGNGSILVQGGSYTTFTVDGIFGGNSLGSNDINNFTSNTVLTGTSGRDTIRNYAKNVTINADSGDDSIHNEGYNSSINAGNGNDTVYNEGSYVTIDAGAGNNSIKNYYGESIQIYSGNGADYIENEGGNNLTINAGVGNNNIKNSVGSNVQIYTGADNDSVSNEKGSNYVTINAGAGADYISNYGASVQVYAGDGNDYIYNAEENNDVNNVTIDAGAGNDSIRNYGASVQIYVGAGNDYIYNSNLNSSYYGRNDSNITIDAGAGNNYIYNNGSNVNINGGAGDDLISLASYSENNVIEFSNVSGNDTVYGLKENDTLQIIGTSYTTARSGSDLIIGVGDNSILAKNAANTNFKISGNYSGGGTDTGSGGNDTTPADTLQTGITVKNSIVTAAKTFTGNEINLADYDATKLNAAALSQAVSIVGTAANNSIKGGKGADSIYGGSGNDTVSLGGGKDIYIYSSGNDFIQDYKAGEDKISLASGSITSASVSSSNVILKTSNGNITVKNGKGKNITIIDSSGNETSNIYPVETLPAGLTVKNSIVTAAKTFTGNEINLADYDATKVNAAALSQAVSIVGTAANNSLKGGKGADTISGGAGNDTVSLGGGKDIYIYSGGNDFIQDYKAGEDKISLASGSITSASVSSSNVILKTSNGNITVKNGKDKKITVIDSSGNETSNIYPVETLPAGITIKNSIVTASSSFTEKTIDLADYEKVTKVDASALSKAVSIVGNSANNSLSGGKGADTIFGGAGNDTLYGGAGNDTLTGGNGKDIFVYSGGKDVITDYTAGQDKIKIESGTISKTSYSGDDVIFKIGSGTLTVKDGKGKNISVTDSSGTQTYSRTLDILYDNNFMTDDSNLDSITEQKFAVTEIQNYNEDFAQVSTLLTFAKEK